MNVTDYNFIDLNYLELMTDGDIEAKKEIIELILNDLTLEFPLLKTHFENDEFEQMHRISHKFKSTMAFVGNELLSETNLRIEEITKSGKDTDQIKGLLDIAESLLPDIIAELKNAYSLF